MLETTYSASLRDDQFAAYLDVDFYEEAKKRGRTIGSTGRDELCGTGGFPLYSDENDLIPEKDWKDLIAAKNAKGGMCRPYIRYRHDQDGEPSCVSNATVLSHEVAQCVIYGPENVIPLSPISLYRFVGSRNSGSSISANLNRMKSIGALPLDIPANKARFQHTHPHNGYNINMPSGWETTASQFLIQEYFDIDTWQAFVSALLKGFSVIYARSGHCILGVGLAYRNGLLVLEYMNSWGDWGSPVNDMFDSGIGFDSERVARGASYGAVAVRTVRTPAPPVSPPVVAV